MGNVMFNRRTPQNGPPPGYPHSQTTPVGHIPYYNSGYPPPDVRMQHYPHVHIPTNGQSYMSMPSGPSPPVTQQKVMPIHNEVNVNKSTVHLERDEENPGYHLVAFTFDAVVSGSISIFFRAREGPDFSLIAQTDRFQPVRVPFEKGLAQKFVQPSGSGVKLSAFDLSDLLEVKEEVYPLVLRAETSESSRTTRNENSIIIDTKGVGAPLPKHVGAQTTNCILEEKEGEFSVKVIKQIIWVEGTRYELQEIYGIETVDGGINSSEFGKECVVCLSEPRDTTVLPCRHMCLCSGCADLLRQPNQINRCPICRTPIRRLLAIDISKGETTTV